MDLDSFYLFKVIFDSAYGVLHTLDIPELYNR